MGSLLLGWSEQGDRFGSMMSSKYASYLCADKLSDGTALIVRAIRPDDKDMLQFSLQHLSDKSQYFRFHAVKSELSQQELVYFTEIDFVNHVGLLAVINADGVDMLVGVGRFVRTDGGSGKPTAELAFTVAEKYQRHGVATLLFGHLLKIAREYGIANFLAFVLPENRLMLAILRNSGLPLSEIVNSAGVIEITLSLDRTE